MSATSETATGRSGAGTPQSVEPFVRALGAKAAVTFLLKFGGQVIRVPAKPTAATVLTREIGVEQACALHAVFGHGQVKVPLAKPWIARQLDADGIARPEIAKMLHVTRESVRMYLAKPKAAA